MKNRLLFILCTLIITSCSQKSQYFTSPHFLGITNITPTSISLGFDQPVHLSNIVLDSALTLEDFQGETIFFSQTNVAQSYSLQATASQGLSSLRFSLHFIGMPLEAPVPLVVNELSIIQNKKITNAIEFKALADGNLAGTTVYLGTPVDYRARFVFPDHAVNENDLIILHADKEENFFFVGSPKLGNTREVITIAQHPYTVPYYGLAYEKASASQANSIQKRNFDRNYLYLLEHSLWLGMPIDSTYITATRSLNRQNKPVVTPEDASNWYVTITSGSSIGYPNNPNQFIPKDPTK